MGELPALISSVQKLFLPLPHTLQHFFLTSLSLHKGHNQDLLFLLTERHNFCVLSFDREKGEIITRANGDIHDTIRPTDIGPIAVIDTEFRLIGIHAFEGSFKVIPMDENGILKEPFTLRLDELSVIDIKVFRGAAKPTIVVLYQDTKEARHVKTYEISLEDRDFKEGPWQLANVEGGASTLITLPKPIGGTIILGEQSIVYHDGTTFRSLSMKTTLIKAWGKLDDGRLLLGDHVGKLYVLVLERDGDKVTSMHLEELGVTSYPSTITYLDSGVVYIGSVYGDSELINLNVDKGEDGKFVEVLESFYNLGPIVDFCIVDLERQGQGQVVTCSGAYKDGSLRIVRNGIGINEHATIELEGVTGIWSLDPAEGNEAGIEKFLVLGFVGETRVLSLVGEGLEETEVVGFVVEGETTVFAAVTSPSRAIQVTEKGVYLVSLGAEQKRLAEWKPPNDQKINVCSCFHSQLLVATGGKRLYYLEVGESGLEVKG